MRDSKTGLRAVPFGKAARALIDALPGERDLDALLFPRYAEGHGTYSLATCWRTVCEDAKLGGLRLHESKLWNEFVARYHYLGYKTLVGAQMRYAVHDRDGWPVAMLGFSTAAWKLAPRDNFIGWIRQTREKNLPFVVDNPRFLILPWINIPNLGSHGPDGPIGAYVRTESERALAAYRSQPSRVDEDANREQDTAQGGYARRQIVELVQNASDQLTKTGGARIGILLTATHLYVADNGCPIDEPGARAMMLSHLSPKRGTDEIGRFGVGFKSVLGVTDSPGFFSRSGSFVFDRESVARRIRDVVPNADRYPVLRIAEPVTRTFRPQTIRISLR